MFFIVILYVILICGLLFLVVMNKKYFQENEDFVASSKKISDRIVFLIKERNSVIEDCQKLEKNRDNLQRTEKQLRKECYHYNELLDTIKQNYNSNLQELADIYEEKTKQLNLQQQEKNDKILKEYEEKKSQIIKEHDEFKEKLKQEKEEIEGEIAKIRDTLHSLIEAQLREKEIKEKQDFYCLQLKEGDLQDVKALQDIKAKLSKPEVINKIVWSVYYQPNAKAKFCQIIGSTQKVCGIYKITNRVTGETYVGQSLDIYSRWTDHCKNALGVGSNKGTNKLYSNMKEYGLNNFSFEVLEKCTPDFLNEKEKYYIQLYDSYNYGLNSNAGIGKE